MDLDREVKAFLLTNEETGLLGLHPTANIWPFESVGELADAVSEALVRTHDIDPSSEPAGARRNALIEKRTRNLNLLSPMLPQISQVAEETVSISQEAEDFLRSFGGE